MTTAELIEQALRPLQPAEGFHKPSQDRISEAHARGVIATASALNRIADVLEVIADNTTPQTALRPAIRHSN